MLFKYLVILCVIIGYIECNPSIQQKDFYYWRDYSGNIPPNAFVAGRQADGSPTYIGTARFIGRAVWPTIIKANKEESYLIVGTLTMKTKQTQILCSTNNSLFNWIQTDVNRIKSLNHCKLIDGGELNGTERVKIGRANNQGRIITGRVLKDGLYIHDTNNKEMKVVNFEVLAYDCKKQ